MTELQLERGQEIRHRLNALKQTREKVQYALDHVEMENESAQTCMRVYAPSNSTKSFDIESSNFIKGALSEYLYTIDMQIVELEKEFKAL